MPRLKREERCELRLSVAERRAQLAAAQRADRSWSSWARLVLAAAAGKDSGEAP